MTHGVNNVIQIWPRLPRPVAPELIKEFPFTQEGLSEAFKWSCHLIATANYTPTTAELSLE